MLRQLKLSPNELCRRVGLVELDVPDSLLEHIDRKDAYENVAGLTAGAFKSLLDAGVPPEDAAQVLSKGWDVDIGRTRRYVEEGRKGS